MIINRLILNLRLFDQHAFKTTTGPVSEVQFGRNRVLGTIGAPIEPQQWETILNEYDIEYPIEDVRADTEVSHISAAEVQGQVHAAVPTVRIPPSLSLVHGAHEFRSYRDILDI